MTNKQNELLDNLIKTVTILLNLYIKKTRAKERENVNTGGTMVRTIELVLALRSL